MYPVEDMLKKWGYLTLTIVTMSVCVSAKISCRNMIGGETDWFVAVKLPANVDKWSGRGFVYYDSSYKDWTLSTLPISSTKSAIGSTISQLYSKNKNELRVAYSDDWPGTDKTNSGRGHSKGVLVSNFDGGFWLIHSVPNFPPKKKYDYPESGTKYAQSLLCISFNIDELSAISQYMRYAQVTPYTFDLPVFFSIIAPYLVDVKLRKSLSRSETSFTFFQNIRTRDGMNVGLFSKHKKFRKDLWHDFIASNLGAPFAVETWRNGAAKDVGTTCGIGPNVYDITEVRLPAGKFSNSKDHSKWGVSVDKAKPFVCIGGINRQISQYNRGGGAACIKNVPLWKTFYNSVYKFNGCDFKEKQQEDHGEKQGKNHVSSDEMLMYD